MGLTKVESIETDILAIPERITLTLA